ncbi:21574_t:CDS:1, partial [Dentiscutata erythropus]
VWEEKPRTSSFRIKVEGRLDDWVEKIRTSSFRIKVEGPTN